MGLRMCPGNDESAGKRRSGKTRKGSNWFRSALTESAHAAARTKGSYLSAKYGGIRGRRGSKKAAVAVGHSIVVICYHLLERKVPYEDLGEDYLHNRRCSMEARKTGQLLGIELIGLTLFAVDQPRLARIGYKYLVTALF